MTEAKFFVPGDPVPKGSAKAFFRKGMRFPVVVQDNAAKQKPWASIIAVIAQQKGVQISQKAIALELRFFMRRPKAHYTCSGCVKPRFFDEPHVKKPDLDKLIRCVKDALKGVAFLDDSQVVDVSSSKMYGEQPGCQIWIREA